MANNPAGAPVPGSWGQQQKSGMDRQDKNAVENQARRIAEGGEEKDQAMQKDQTSQQPFDPKGDDRTPEKPIGEVAYAHRAPTKKKTGEF